MPLTGIIAYFALGEVLSTVIIGMAVSIVGILIVVTSARVMKVMALSWAGVGCALLAALCQSSGNVLTRAISPNFRL